MILFNQLFKITGQFIFVITIIFFSTLQAKNLDKFNKANNIANYFSEELKRCLKFFVDMTTINVQDLTGGSKERLEGHLRSDDFFSVESFPSAQLDISSSELISDGKWMVNASLTIKDISHPVTFEMSNTEKLLDRVDFDIVDIIS